MSASPDFGAIRPQAGWRTEPVVAKPLRWRGPLAASFALHALALVAMLVWTSDATDSTAPEPIEVEIVAAPLMEAPPVAEPSPTPVAEAPPAPPVVEPPPPVAEAPPPPPAMEAPPPPVAETPPPPPVAETPAPAEPPPPPVVEASPPPPAVETPPPVAETPPPPSPTPLPEPTPVVAVTPVPQPVVAPPPPPPTAPSVAKATPAPKPKVTPKPRPSPARDAAQSAPASAPAPVPAAASAASSSDVANYRAEVTGRIAARKHYPDAALERGPRGLAIVNFTLDGQGQLLAASLAKSAGDPILDADALATVRRAAPFGPPPAGAPHAYSAPLNYQPR